MVLIKKANKPWRRIGSTLAKKDNVPELNPLDSAILNSLNVNIAVLDSTGVIISVNEAWKRFGRQNGASAEVQRGIGMNYLEICQTASGEHSQEAKAAQQGIQSVLNGTENSFTLEYPCHSPDQKRWFLLTASPLSSASNSAVILHIDITGRKLLENARLIETNKTHRERFRALTARLAEAEELERRRLHRGCMIRWGKP